MSISETILKVRQFINQGPERSVKVKKNVLYMLLLKSGSILMSLLLVPLSLNYVDSATYGIWLTLSSMVTWIHFFDIGINNGLKNKLAEAFAKGDFQIGKKYVSTTYALLSLIFIPLMMLILIIIPFVNWSLILNLPQEDCEGLGKVISILVAYFCANFIFSTINIILQADQRPADAAFRAFINQFASIVVIYILTLTTKGSLLNLCIGLSFAPLVITILFNYTLFSSRYKTISPSLSAVDFKVAPSLLKLGVLFFINQIAFMVNTQLSSFLILRYYGAVDVTNYNISQRYFSVLTMIWGIIISPIWAAVTDAVTQEDYTWIKNTLIKYLRIIFLFIFGATIMLAMSSTIYDWWLGNKVSIPFVISFWMMLYEITRMFHIFYVQVLNGAGILKLQTIFSLVSPFLFLISFFVLMRVGLGCYSVIIASIIGGVYGYLVAPIQCHRIFKSKSL